MIGHLGSRVSALLDGQLPTRRRPSAPGRTCTPATPAATCVEREGWVKTRLAGLSCGRDRDARPPQGLPARHRPRASTRAAGARRPPVPDVRRPAAAQHRAGRDGRWRGRRRVRRRARAGRGARGHPHHRPAHSAPACPARLAGPAAPRPASSCRPRTPAETAPVRRVHQRGGEDGVVSDHDQEAPPPADGPAASPGDSPAYDSADDGTEQTQPVTFGRHSAPDSAAEGTPDRAPESRLVDATGRAAPAGAVGAARLRARSRRTGSRPPAAAAHAAASPGWLWPVVSVVALVVGVVGGAFGGALVDAADRRHPGAGLRRPRRRRHRHRGTAARRQRLGRLGRRRS